MGGLEERMEMRPRCVRRVCLSVMVLSAALTLGPALAAAVDVGDLAPDFSLPSTTGQSISLSQFRGNKLVLIEFHINDFGMT
jgi:hypothetical protein